MHDMIQNQLVFVHAASFTLQVDFGIWTQQILISKSNFVSYHNMVEMVSITLYETNSDCLVYGMSEFNNIIWNDHGFDYD